MVCEKVGGKRTDHRKLLNLCFFNVFRLRHSFPLHGSLSWFSHAHSLGYTIRFF